MTRPTFTLLLTELEAELVEEALDLYVRARPVPADHRYEYRYRAARSVLDSLRHGTRAAPSGSNIAEDGDPPDDDGRGGRHGGPWEVIDD